MKRFDAILQKSRALASRLATMHAEPFVILEAIDVEGDGIVQEGSSIRRTYVLCETHILRVQPADYAVAGLWRVLEIIEPREVRP